VSITKVVVFSTTNPTKLVLHFSEFSTIFYAFYKFQQNGYTIEDVTLRRGPRKHLGPRNWVPRLTGRRAHRKSGGSGGAPGRGNGRGGPQAHLGRVGARRLGEEGTDGWRAAMAGSDGRGGSGCGKIRGGEVQRAAIGA
jgi:hypothetical protein